MQGNYCLPIIKNTKQAVLDEIKKHGDYDFYEIWLDYIEDFDEAFIRHLLETYEKRLIFLFRRKKLEKSTMARQKREAIIQMLEGKAAYLDLDLSQTVDLEFIKHHAISVNLIASYHNYDHTPDDTVLGNIINELRSLNPSIIKLSTFCKSEADAVRLLQIIIELKGEKQKYIVLGMGKFGTITRLAGALWENAITFAPANEVHASAPGQLTKKEMETIESILNSKS